jgi:Tol biopolymer transport system component
MKSHLFFVLLATSLVAIFVRTPLEGGDAVKPVNLEKLNTESDETDPFPSADGLSLLYATNAFGTFDIFQAKRTSATVNWPSGKPLVASKDADERSPFLFKGSLYYASNEVPDAKFKDLKNFDLYQKAGERAPIPVQALCDKTDEMYPWITPAGKEFYFSRKTDDGWTQFVANGPTPGPIGKERPVGFPAGFHRATLTPSATVMYLQGPLENDRVGIFRSKRSKVGDKWSAPEPVTALNHPEAKRGDLAPCLNVDGTRLYFASDRPGGRGGLDLWSVPLSQLK